MSYEWIIIASPTIMNGLVLRWYANEEQAIRVEPHVSASRNRVLIHCDCELSQDAVPEAEHAHQLLSAAYERNYERVKVMATHDHPMFSDEIIAITRRDS